MNKPIVGALRIAVIAEGSGESLGLAVMPPAPGDVLWDDLLGAAHILVQRLIKTITAAGVTFVQPPRHKGRIAVGSDLLHRRTLRRLLTWFDTRAPHFSIVIVDRDGEADRLAVLAAHVEGIVHTHVIAVSVEAFEAWLAIDEQLPDSHPAGEIKQRVSRDRQQRIAISRTMDLARQMSKSPSLGELHRQLALLLPRLLQGS